jgi:pyruvate oxidase
VPEVYLGSEAFQEIDQLELFHPFTAYAETIARADQAVALTMSAAKYAYQTPGVSVLSTPTDVLRERSSIDTLDPGRRLHRGAPQPPDDEIARAVELVNASGRVAILAGWGTRHHGALLTELSEKLKAPIATTSRAKGAVPETERRSVGVLGSIGGKRAGRAFQGAELVLVIGTGFRHARLIPPGTKIIQVDRDSTRIGRTFDVDAGIHGDAGAALAGLVAGVAPKATEDAEWWGKIDADRSAFIEDVTAAGEDRSAPINPGFVMQALQRNVASDAVITVDVGDHSYWFYRDFICSGQSTYLSANIASMGFGLPAALSAQLDYPDRQVVCLTGDGGFAMLMADFTTAVREKLPINIVVMNDGRLKNIKKEQAGEGYPEFGISFPNPDFAAFARSCGGLGYRVESPGDLDAAMSEAFASDRPTIIDVVVDPERVAASARTVA